MLAEDRYRHLAVNMIRAALKAGSAEMDVYRQDFTVDTKKDNSPVTIADRIAEGIILDQLSAVAPDIPVVAEEAASEGNIPSIGDCFFLVDPLDGTREFIQKSDEFTVNIAMIEHGVPVFGLVYAPAIEQLFLTLSPTSAFAGTVANDARFDTIDDLGLRPILTAPAPKEGVRAVASKSHMTEETKAYLEKLKVADLKSAGSSLKFCLLADGQADLYPRFGPTMEWDTAAGHAVLLAAGGEVVMEDGEPLMYGKVAQGYKNPFFIARAYRQ